MGCVSSWQVSLKAKSISPHDDTQLFQHMNLFRSNSTTISFSFMFFSRFSFHSWSIISYSLPMLHLYSSINSPLSSTYSLLLAYDTSICFYHLAFLCTLSLHFKQCLEHFGEKRPFERLNDKNEVNWLSIQSPVLAVLWLILYPTALTL